METDQGMKKIYTGALFVVVLLTGCATPTMYSWGHYEDLIYVSYEAPDKMPPEKQIEVLEADYQKARSKNKPVPPGFHAHLGYLYYQIGKVAEARSEFATEEANYPESKVFMDRLMSSLDKEGKQ